MLLGAASQRFEYLALELIGTPWMLEVLADWKFRERGAIPGPTEAFIIIFVISKFPAHCLSACHATLIVSPPFQV